MCICPLHTICIWTFFFNKKCCLPTDNMLIQRYMFVVFILLLCLEKDACIRSLWSPDVTKLFTFKWLINSCSDLGIVWIYLLFVQRVSVHYTELWSLGWRLCVCLRFFVHVHWPCCPQEWLQVSVRHCGYDIRQAMWQEGRAAQMKGKQKTTRQHCCCAHSPFSLKRFM